MNHIHDLSALHARGVRPAGALRRVLVTAVLALGLALGVGGLGGAPIAAAEASVAHAPTSHTAVAADAPLDFAGQVHDAAGALGPRTADVTAALDLVEAETPYRLVVAVVSSFDGTSAEEWASTTASLSDLSEQDFLLAIATEDRRYALSVPEDADLTSLALHHVRVDHIEPALMEDDWAGAVISGADALRAATVEAAAAEGVEDVEIRASFGPIIGFVLVIVALMVLAVWYADRRSQRKVQAVRAGQAGPPLEPSGD